jgi:hypothetical protein
VNGDQRHWADPLAAERKATWEEHREKIMGRWVRPSRPGWRPDAWLCFDLPKLAKTAAPWRRDALERWSADPSRTISVLEFVHGLKATSDEERAGIEELWRDDLRLLAENCCAEIDVPPWFVLEN